VPAFGGAIAPTATLFYNCDVRLLTDWFSVSPFNAVYMQDSRLGTFNDTTVQSYGFFTVGAGIGGGQMNVVGAVGLGIFDWPVVAGVSDCALHLSFNSLCTVAAGTADLYGTDPGQATAVGVRVDTGSKFYWNRALGTHPSIAGTGASGDFILERAQNHLPARSWDSEGTGTLVNGVATISAVNLFGTTAIVATIEDPTGTLVGFSALTVPLADRTPGSGTGSFKVHAVNNAGADLAGANYTFNWIARTPALQCITWAQWVATPFNSELVSETTGACICQALPTAA
jgi:hypothetical protein